LTKTAGMNKRLNKQDSHIIHAMEPVVETIAEVFGHHCEVVLHSLEDPRHSVVKIVNGHVTGRKVGSPLTDYSLDMLKSTKEDMHESYYTRLDNGKLLKSATTVLRNAQGNAIGILCINIDLSAPLLDFLKSFSPSDDGSSKTADEHFPSTLDELVSITLERAFDYVNSQRGVSAVEKNKMVVMEFYERGMFKISGVIDIVARQLGISRYTVYNYLREAKFKNEGR